MKSRRADVPPILRPFLFTMLGALLCIACFGQADSGQKQFVYVGTYTNHGSQGIYGYAFDPHTGKLAALGLAAASVQPSFLAIAPNRKFLYAANETESFDGQPTGSVSAFAIDRQTGKLSFLNQMSSRDQGPAYVTVDRSGKFALVANYSLGSVAVLPVLADGRLAEASAFVQHHGSSVNPERQQGPHAHAIAMSPDNRFALVADLGLDEIVIYPFDAEKGALGTAHVVHVGAGSGPRHLVFAANGKFLYLINELKSTVTVFAYRADDGTLRELQTISALPAGFSGKSTAAEIELLPSGRFLYSSNRGDDSLAVFAIDPAKGTLTYTQRISTQGKTPRNFAVDPSGKWLLAANQDSNNIVIFRIDPKTGRLTPNGEVTPVGSPACVVFVDGLRAYRP